MARTIRERPLPVPALPRAPCAPPRRLIFEPVWTNGQPKRIGVNVELKPHAYDPATQPELFEGVLARRVVAFLIDVIIISVPLVFLAIFMFVFGLVTLGLGWFLFALYGPIAVIWALVYYGMTFGGPASATIGMRMMDLEMRTWYGAPAYFVLGAVHAIGYWLTVSFLTPFILLVAPVQRAQAAAARHAGRHHRDQQRGARERAAPLHAPPLTMRPAPAMLLSGQSHSDSVR